MSALRVLLQPSVLSAAACAAPSKPRRLVLAVAAALGVGLLLPTAAQALSFGTARLDSALGQPLDLRIPLLGDDVAELAGDCVRLLPASDSDVPTLNVGRVTIERDGLLTSLRVRGLEPMNEPALRVIVEAGCQRRMQREYVLLIDPPAVPAQAAAAPPGVAPLAPASASDLELGPAEIRAMRGRPLLIRVPLHGPQAPRLSAACVRTVSDGGSPPPLASARTRLVDAGSASPVLEISTREALSERSVRVIAELGCEQPIRREFDLLVETPPPSAEAALPSSAEAAPAAARPARRPQADSAVRPRQAAAPAAPAAATKAPAPVAAPPAAPASQAARPAAPATEAPPSKKDRLVLAAPEDATPPPSAAAAPLQTEEFVRKLDELATEVKRLRAELDAANQRNAQLTERLARGDSVNLGWAVAAGASLLLAALIWLSGRRSKPQAAPRAESVDAEGPMTRIVGQRSKAQRAEPPAAAPAAAPTIAGAVGGTLMTGPLSDVQSQGHSIQVTEMGDEEAIRELYADFVTRQDAGAVTARAEPAPQHSTRPDERTRIEPGTRFGDDVPATRMTVPLTTQLAVDIDLTPDAATQMKAGELPSFTQAPTRPLELDLELHLPTQAQASVKPEDKERKDG